MVISGKSFGTLKCCRSKKVLTRAEKHASGSLFGLFRELGKHHIDLATALDAPYIRVFGDRIPDIQSREKIIEQVIEGLLALARYAEGTGVQVLLESHGDFARLQNLLDVIQAVHHPQVGVLWDVHHPF
jgi:sugar phosphate isomerase/epimerase